MISDGMAAVLRLLHGGDGALGVPDITVAAADALAMDGLAVSLVTGGDLAELVWCSGETCRAFEDLQFTLGEGPGPDAVRTGEIVCVPDLARGCATRWPTLTVESSGLSARAVFCFPMGIGAIRIGVLTAVRRSPGPLTEQQTDDSLFLAAALTARCLTGGEPRQDASAPLGSPHSLQHAVVHQATGMISVQLTLPLPLALLRLRAHAYSTGRSVTDIAEDVVKRRLRLDQQTSSEPPPAVEKD